MKLEETIVSELVYDLRHRLIKKVITQLKRDNAIVHKDKEECIENLWEEFCISLQDKTSSFSHTDYKKHILELLKDEFATLSHYEKVAIWIKTPDGIDWFYDKKEKSSNISEVPVHFVECEEVLYSELVDIAKEYDNDNIYRYMNMECKAFKEDYSEDDRELVYE